MSTESAHAARPQPQPDRWTGRLGGSIRSLLPIRLAHVILVRHADYDGGGIDAPLNQAGLTRAKTLRDVLGRTDLDSIFVTQRLRTQQTARPTATARGIQPETVNAIPQIVSRLRTLPAGSTSLVVGHSDTVPDICAELGAEVDPIGPAQFDNMYVLLHGRAIRWGPWYANVAHLRYGALTHSFAGFVDEPCVTVGPRGRRVSQSHASRMANSGAAGTESRRHRWAHRDSARPTPIDHCGVTGR